MPGDWIVVGRLFRVRGIRGEVLGEVYSSKPDRAEKLRTVRLDLNGRTCSAEVENVWWHDGRPVFKFKDIDSIEAAEVWQGADILVPESEKVGPEEGEYSYEALIGCKVVSADDAEVGLVRGIEEFGGPTLLRVQIPDGREILIPFARAICVDIDVARKMIRVDLPEGLAEVQT